MHNRVILRYEIVNFHKIGWISTKTRQFFKNFGVYGAKNASF